MSETLARVDLEFDHLGLATKDMARARKLLSNLGYTVSEVVPVPVQTVNVCFARSPGHPTIELIEPASDGSPIEKILEKVGSGPYHLCYRTVDLSVTARELKARGFIALGPEFVSGPLGEQRTGFFHNASIGMIEVTETKR